MICNVLQAVNNNNNINNLILPMLFSGGAAVVVVIAVGPGPGSSGGWLVGSQPTNQLRIPRIPQLLGIDPMILWSRYWRLYG